MSDENLKPSQEETSKIENVAKQENNIAATPEEINNEQLTLNNDEASEKEASKIVKPSKEENTDPETRQVPEVEDAQNQQADLEDTLEEEDEEEVQSSDQEDHEDDDQEEVDYSSLNEKQLIATLKKLIQEKPIPQIKIAVEEIKTEFNAKFAEELNAKKEEFIAEGGNIIDFKFTTPLKKEFNSLYFDYKEKRNNYYKNLKRDLQENLSKRNELIEQLKSLLTVEDNINNNYKKFKEIQEQWHLAGPIPRDNYNLVWNNYRHHVENFYNFLHLNREFRELDYKHNLDQKLKIIARAQELTQEEDINKAFRELQMLHKMWKEDIGPVAEEFNEDIWEKFSAATQIIHDKRQKHYEALEEEFEKNFEEKQKIIASINEEVNQKNNSHNQWQTAIKRVQKLRDQYFEIGKVPRIKNKEIWEAFKTTTRAFNQEKNNFYKAQKKEQYENLEKKKELIKIAQANKDSDDFEVVTPLMKKIQTDWKKIGHVPRKVSDTLWKEFKDACNFYFDRLHAEKNEAFKDELKNLEAKETLLAKIKKIEVGKNPEEDLEKVKDFITQWKNIGKVPYKKKNIDQDFNKHLDTFFKQLDVSKKEAELIKFENKLNAIADQEDERKLQNEAFFISKKITETENEIRQLENNLGFFQNADANNPLVKEVQKNINKQKQELDTWKEKLKALRNFKNE